MLTAYPYHPFPTYLTSISHSIQEQDATLPVEGPILFKERSE
ncbi:hypothetical protein SAMN04490192_2269 [Pseudomonas lundensis]|nr:hypothetical protein SAMN04490192_2269 [Pseudomonas lundensis]